MKTLFRKSEVRRPVFERDITVPELMILAMLIGLQNVDAQYDANTAMRWTLAYWRADREDFERHDRACIFFHGRFGLDTMSMDDVYLEWEATFSCMDDGIVSASVVNNFVKWAFDHYIEWVPEPPARHITPVHAVMISAKAALMMDRAAGTLPLDVSNVMTKLAENFVWSGPVWYALADATRMECEQSADGRSFRIRVLTESELLLIVDVIDTVVYAVPAPGVGHAAE